MNDPALGASEFLRLAGVALERVESMILDAGVDADAAFVSEGVLEIEFDAGGKMVLNRHDVTREVWLAGRTGAHHFRWDGTEWRDTRSACSLLEVAAEMAGQIAGRTVLPPA